MAKKYIKRCSTSLVLREMQTKATMRYQFLPTRMTIFQKTDNDKCCKDMEKLALSYIASGIIEWGSHFGKQSGSPSKMLNIRLII